MHVLILGATGATGKDLLAQLLADATVSRVDVFVRRPLLQTDPKLKVHVVDFSDPSSWKNMVKGDVLFSCLGTTLKAAGSKEAQWKIDHDLQLAFAQAASENGVPHYVLISADMASAKSRIFYSRMKGQLEDEVRALGFSSLDIFNPPLLVRKDTDRGGERTAKKILGFFNSIGMFRSQRPLPTEVLAKAMIRVAKEGQPGFSAYRGLQIWDKAGLV